MKVELSKEQLKTLRDILNKDIAEKQRALNSMVRDLCCPDEEIQSAQVQLNRLDRIFILLCD